MTIFDTVRHALGNLRRQRLRTVLTCLGIAVGVTTTAIMMAFPAGVSRVLAQRLDRQELMTTIFVLDRPMRLPTSFADLRTLRRLDQTKAVALDDELVTELKKIEGVVTVYPSIPALVTCEAVEPRVADQEIVTGVPPDGITDGYREAIVEGSWWSAQATHGVCALPSAELAKYGFEDAKSAIGKTLALSEIRSYVEYDFDPPQSEDPPPGKVRHAKRPKGLRTIDLTITGVFESDKIANSFFGAGLMVPLEQARQLASEMRGPFRLRDNGRYNQLIVKTVDRQHVEGIRDKLTARNLGTLMSTDVLYWLNGLFTVIETALGVFGAIALFVAFFGIANTMVMAVLERTREIGILKALGGRDRDVWLSFVTEAGAIGALGGATGVGVAVLACVALNGIANGVIKSKAERALEVFYVSPLLGFGLIAFATAVAVVAGLYPAFRASRLDPVEALRRE